MNNFWNNFKKWIMKNKKILPFVIILVSISFMRYNMYATANKAKEVSYKEFIKMVDKKTVTKVDISLDSPKFKFEDNNKKVYSTDNPKDKDFKKFLLEKDVKVEEVNKTRQNAPLDLLLYALKMVILIVALKFAMDFIQPGSMKKGKDDPIDTIPNVKFSSIAGNQESKDEMLFLVDFLKKPKKYSDMGATLPKGVIFYGPPGTGKTLTAKAIAGEAGVPFFSVSGSDFVEMYVGLGAKRVRELFDKARKKAPCIIFIDEIDAVGTKRGNDNNSEKDQTINALLNELDGFDGSEGIIVIAATNRVENLDSALIRPGRFDKHIPIYLPDAKDRLEILKVHTKNKKISDDVNLEELSKLTIGFSGAGLCSLVNEATIIAVTKNRKLVTKEDVDSAYFKIVMGGSEKKNTTDRLKEEITLVAWHEAGHALASKLLRDMEVPKVTIVPSTSGAGGATFFTPRKMGLFSKKELMDDVKVSYAGRIGEYLLLKDEDSITTGASNDIQQATETLSNIVLHYGMNKNFGMVNVSQLAQSQNSLNDIILSEITTLSKGLYEETLNLLMANKDTLERIATALIEKESLSEVELDNIIESKKDVA